MTPVLGCHYLLFRGILSSAKECFISRLSSKHGTGFICRCHVGNLSNHTTSKVISVNWRWKTTEIKMKVFQNYNKGTFETCLSRADNGGAAAAAAPTSTSPLKFLQRQRCLSFTLVTDVALLSHQQLSCVSTGNGVRSTRLPNSFTIPDVKWRYAKPHPQTSQFKKHLKMLELLKTARSTTKAQSFYLYFN